VAQIQATIHHHNGPDHKEDGLDETPGSHLKNSRIACKVLRRIYFLTVTVHFPLARAIVALEFCCVDV